MAKQDTHIIELLHLVWRHTTMAEEALRALYDDPDDEIMQKAVTFHARRVRDARLTYRQATVKLLLDEQGVKQ